MRDEFGRVWHRSECDNCGRSASVVVVEHDDPRIERICAACLDGLAESGGRANAAQDGQYLA